MKIYSMEIETAPLEVEPQGDMPPLFRSLTEMLWRVLCDVAMQSPTLTSPKAEA
jgi:hypothetical protein